MPHPLTSIPTAFHRGEHLGITSVCSAHPLVIEAALELAKDRRKIALIEATCNQVNQDGGYTGMTPTDFRSFVEGIAEKVGFPKDGIVLGGDHLGPNPWKHLPEKEAMKKAEEMIAAYAQAGFTKLHLDTSMGCQGEPEALADDETAGRAATLAKVAEANKGALDPVYVIGTEVPVPGGATHALDDNLDLTEPSAVATTYNIHKDAFGKLGLQDAFSRVIALVVQPGVEFGHTDVIQFNAEKAGALSRSLSGLPGIVFEAHSTDYQADDNLRALVANGYSILKVGPWLTFALREALYALDSVADTMEGKFPQHELMLAMEDAMLAEPDNWSKYYSGNESETRFQRHFSLSDRIRYYWPSSTAREAVERLADRLDGKKIPTPILSQFFGASWLRNTAANDHHSALVKSVKNVLLSYEHATSGKKGVECG